MRHLGIVTSSRSTDGPDSANDRCSGSWLLARTRTTELSLSGFSAPQNQQVSYLLILAVIIRVCREKAERPRTGLAVCPRKRMEDPLGRLESLPYSWRLHFATDTNSRSSTRKTRRQASLSTFEPGTAGAPVCGLSSLGRAVETRRIAFGPQSVKTRLVATGL